MPVNRDAAPPPSGGDAIDSRYVAARRVLLDALEALAPHRQAVIVAGAQAVYLRTGLSDIGIAPYTTDGDLALDPTLLGDEPELEASMRDAGFQLLESRPHRPEPGIWVATAIVEGEELVIPVDLIVPEGAASGGGRRGARLGPHGNRAARRAVGLEAAQAGVGEEREHEPVALALAAKVLPPDVVAFGRGQQAGELAPVEHVRERLPLLRRPQHQGGSRSRHSFSTQKRKKHLSAATVRAWLPSAGRRSTSAARKRRRSGGRTRRRSSIPCSFRKRTQAVTSRS